MYVISIRWIGEGALLASFKLEIVDGIIVRCNVFQRKDDGRYFATPAAVKLPGFDGYRSDIEFSSKKQSKMWGDRAHQAFWDCVDVLLKESDERISFDKDMRVAVNRCEAHRAKQGQQPIEPTPIKAVLEVAQKSCSTARISQLTPIKDVLEGALVAALGGK